MIRAYTRAISYSAMLVASLLASSAEATNYSIDFRGKLSSAVNFTSDYPDVPSGDFFRVGQSFFGTVGYDTDEVSDVDEGFATIPLSIFNINIGGVDFSQRFEPRLLGRGEDGSITFLSGGGSQGGSASLDLNLGPFSGAFPTSTQLAGRKAFFSYNDFQPFGGELSGQATFADGIAQPVPEPQIWASMAVGLGAAGFLAKRRKRNRAQMAA